MTSLRYALLLALAACTADASTLGGGGGGDDGDTGIGTADLSNAKGADYSWSRPNPNTLKQQGFVFVARYLSYDSSKNLTASEATALHNAGLDVVANWESGAQDALSGFNKGVTEAQEALRQANAIGFPPDRPIYFSVDFDAAESQQAAINSYMDGVASVIGRDRVGAYAGYWVIKRLFDAGKIKWGWQTVAWSGGNWDARAQIRQPSINNTCGGQDCDFDNSAAADFGGWGPNTKAATTSTSEGVAAFAYPNQQHYFARDASGALRHMFFDKTSGAVGRDAWGTGIAGTPVTVVAAGAQHAFARGTDGSLQHWFWDPTSGMHGSPWAAAGAIAGDPAAIVIGDFQDVWAVDGAGKLQHWWWGPTTSGVMHDTWGSGVVGRPTVMVSGAQQHVFARGTDGSLQHYWWDAGTISHDTWAAAGSIAGDPAALAIDGGFQDVWAIDGGGSLQHWFWGASTGGVKTDTWGTGVVGRPAMFVINGQQHAFARGTDGSLQHYFWDTSSVKHDVWAPSGVAGDPTAVLVAPGAQHVWAQDAAGHTQHWVWDPAVGHVANDDWGQ